MTTANVTAVQAQVLYSTTPPFANVTMLGSEVLYNSDSININVASFALQAFIVYPAEPVPGKMAIPRQISITQQISIRS